MDEVSAPQRELNECEACARARESERRMPDSLASQTRQLEQTMTCLEEAKLEIRRLEEAAARRPDDPSDANKLRAELDQAQQAMDDLAAALKEVVTESNGVRSELGRSRAEAERLRLEAEESFAAWREKENGFVNCVRILEDEIDRAKTELRSSRVEVSHLRDIVKQAVNESTVVKEALEIARSENSQLKDLLADKDIAYMILKQDYVCLRVSEAAALDSVKELGGLLAAASTVTGRVEQTTDFKPMTKFPSENWRIAPRDPPEEPEKNEGSIFDMFESSPEPEKNRSVDKCRDWEGHSPSKVRKRRQILRAFGDLLRIKSFHK